MGFNRKNTGKNTNVEPKKHNPKASKNENPALRAKTMPPFNSISGIKDIIIDETRSFPIRFFIKVVIFSPKGIEINPVYKYNINTLKNQIIFGRG